MIRWMLIVYFVLAGMLSIGSDQPLAAPNCEARSPSDYETVRTTQKGPYTFIELTNIRELCKPILEVGYEISRVVVRGPTGKVIALFGQQEQPTNFEIVYSFQIEDDIPDFSPFVVTSFGTGGSLCEYKYSMFSKNEPYQLIGNLCSEPRFLNFNNGVGLTKNIESFIQYSFL